MTEPDDGALALFDVEPAPAVAAEPVEHLSAGGRLRVRQQAAVTAGKHPLTKGPLHPDASRDRTRESGTSDPFTCGTCVHRETVSGGRHGYPKCMRPAPGTDPEPPADTAYVPGEPLRAAADRIVRREAWFTRRYPRVSRSAATDVRAWWPACPAYEPIDGYPAHWWERAGLHTYHHPLPVFPPHPEGHIPGWAVADACRVCLRHPDTGEWWSLQTAVPDATPSRCEQEHP